jgi:ATP-dependent RNA helicase HelY
MLPVAACPDLRGHLRALERAERFAADAARRTLTARDFPAPPRPVAHVGLPEPYRPHAPAYLREVAALLRSTRLRPGSAGSEDQPSGHRRGDAAMALAASAEMLPVASCPDLRAHLRALERAERFAADAARLERSIRGRTESLARQFDRVLRVLEAWGYVDGWQLTDAGERLARLYHECDLLVADAIGSGVLDGLDVASVAALVSCFTYEARGPAGTGPAPWFPSKKVRDRWTTIESLAAELNRAEQDAGLPLTRPPDAGFMALAHAWAAGQDLSHVMADEEMSGGDFVRNIKQLIDLLRQLGDLAPEPETAAACRSAADRVFRGVVAASSVIATDEAAIEHGLHEDDSAPRTWTFGP